LASLQTGTAESCAPTEAGSTPKLKAAATTSIASSLVNRKLGFTIRSLALCSCRIEFVRGKQTATGMSMAQTACLVRLIPELNYEMVKDDRRCPGLEHPGHH
jgi:hypothetical protein